MRNECSLSHPNRQGRAREADLPSFTRLGQDDRVDGLYLHLPFCFHKCHYCDFYSVVEPAGQDAPRQAAFTNALIAEINERARQNPLRPATLFAGGGTPTYLREDHWARLLDCLHAHGILPIDATQACTPEFTVEANPETVTPSLMRRLTDGGVNRVSIGAQSFDSDSLKALERWHDPDSVPRAVQACRDAGINNLSLDLIFAIPGQTLAMLERDLDALLALKPSHLSTYGLTYEPNTPLTAKLRVGQVSRIDEDLERAMYELVLNKLEAHSYEHYEISNWAKRIEPPQAEPEPSADPGLPPIDNRCRHNLLYWQNRNWLGVGPGAASHVNGQRWRNTPNLTRYLQDAPHPPSEDQEQLDAAGRFAEQLMLGLRLREGVSWSWFEEHPARRPDQRDTASEWLERGLLKRTDDRLHLTRQGLFVADSVIVKLL